MTPIFLYPKITDRDRWIPPFEKQEVLKTLDKKTLKLRKGIKNRPLQVNDRVKSEHIILEDFKEHFEEFISLKTLEGIASRTISDYLKNHKYLMNFLEGMTRSSAKIGRAHV